jgi:hypothetical protein
MSKLILEQALEHLLNKEEEAASELIHNYYVDIGRKVYEDIMADEVVDEADFDSEEALDDVDASVEEVEDELTEEGDDEEMPMDDEEAVDDMADDMGAEEPVDSDAADVADAMVDVEAALAKLKAEFEDMVGDDSAEADEEMPMADEEIPAESVFSEDEESTEETLEEEAKLKPVGNPDNGDKADQKKSPVAGKNPLGDRPSVKFGGSASGEGTVSGTKPAAAPAAQDMGGTTEPNMSQVATPNNKG